VSESLKRRLVDFARGASTEVTTHDESAIPALARFLPAESVVYVAHTPKAALDDVVRVALQVQAAGFRACPHLVARRIESRRALQTACERLGDAGVDRALVVAGDGAEPAGPFTSSMDVLRTELLPHNDIVRVAVAGHPEGHRAIGPTVLWTALREKQVIAETLGLEMHVVTQFGFDPAAIATWDAHLSEHGIALPVRVGMAGPASLPELIRYAMQCGVGASLRGVLRGMGAMRNVAGLAISPDQMLASIARHALSHTTRIVGVHFYSFGGAVETARWVRAVAEGRSEVAGS
jgi:methylenetetrahydrofolate reductase (NADPH)